MFIDLLREAAILVLLVGALAVLLAGLTPRGLEGFDEAVRRSFGSKRPFGHGEEGR